VLLLTQMSGPSGYYVENCTATLLSPDLVLTARHCISQLPPGLSTCLADGGSTSDAGVYGSDASPGNSIVFVGTTHPATLNPTTASGIARRFFHDDAATLCNHDLAVVQLQRPITGAKVASLLPRIDVTAGEQLYVVGWGATETSLLPEQRMRRDGVTVVTVGPSSTPYPGGVLLENELLASESVCSGDSGGPAFDAETGALVGVVSRGPVRPSQPFGQGCLNTQHTFVKVAAFHDFIAAVFADAGELLPVPDAGAPSVDAGVEPAADAGRPEPDAGEPPEMMAQRQGCSSAPAAGLGWLLVVAFTAGVSRAAARATRT
jgi:hypothetical protein